MNFSKFWLKNKIRRWKTNRFFYPESKINNVCKNYNQMCYVLHFYNNRIKFFLVNTEQLSQLEILNHNCVPHSKTGSKPTITKKPSCTLPSLTCPQRSRLPFLTQHPLPTHSQRCLFLHHQTIPNAPSIKHPSSLVTMEASRHGWRNIFHRYLGSSYSSFLWKIGVAQKNAFWKWLKMVLVHTFMNKIWLLHWRVILIRCVCVHLFICIHGRYRIYMSLGVWYETGP